MELDPADLSIRERYALMTGTILPRPIAVVSTVSPDGRPNLAPFSFFTGLGTNPMSLLFCPANAPDGSEKDTLRNCAPAVQGGTGEFVVSVATGANIRRVVGASEPLPFGASEFEFVGLTPVPSVAVTPPRLAESPVAYECRTTQIIRTNPGAKGGGNLVIGEIVHLYIQDHLVDERYRVDAARLAAVGRMGGALYIDASRGFDLPPGRKAMETGGGAGSH